MRMTGEEYERGLISWDEIRPQGTDIDIYTATWDEDQRPANPEKEGPYANSKGSAVRSPVRKHLTVIPELKTSDSHKTPQLGQIRWERPDGVNVFIDHRRTPPILRVARRPGIALRLTIAPRAAKWDEAQAVFDLDNLLRVRFISGSVSGTQIRPLVSGPPDPNTGSPTMLGGSGIVEANGDLLQVHAGIDDEALDYWSGIERARANCLAMLGLIALICGEQVIGDILLIDGVQTQRDGEHGVDRIPAYGKYPRAVGDQEFEAIDRCLHWATGGPAVSPFQDGVHLGLRWYHKAVMSEDPFDVFTSAFLALETLATSYDAENPLASPRAELKNFIQLLDEARQAGLSIDSAMEGAVKTLLADLPLAEKFGRFRTSLNDRLGLPDDDVKLFRDARNQRNRMLHGGQTEVQQQDASRVVDLLRRLLAAVLEIDLPVDVPEVFHMDVDYVRPAG